MKTVNTIIDRMLQCLDMIDNLPDEDRKALAEEYWNYVEHRHAVRDARERRRRGAGGKRMTEDEAHTQAREQSRAGTLAMLRKLESLIRANPGVPVTWVRPNTDESPRGLDETSGWGRIEESGVPDISITTIGWDDEGRMLVKDGDNAGDSEPADNADRWYRAIVVRVG